MTRQRKRGSNRKQSGRWSGKRDSNSQPSAWKADALAVELFPPMCRSPLTARTASYSYTSVKLVVGGGFEPPKSYDDRFTVCSLWPLGKPSIFNYQLDWSWWTDLNPRPADYKSAALPTELHQHERQYALYHTI